MGPFRGVPSTLVLAFLGAGLLIVGLQTVHFGDQPEFHHTVQPGPADDASLNESARSMSGGSTDRADVVFEYGDLSPSTQELFREALAADGEGVIRRGSGNGAPEFAYPGDHVAPGSGQYYVAYRGDYYRIQTNGDGGFPGLPERIAAGVLLALGAPMMLVGLAWTDRLRATASTLTGVAGVVVPTLSDFTWFGATGLLELVGLGLGLGLVTSLGTWYLLGPIRGGTERPQDDRSTPDRRPSIAAAYGSLTLLVVLGFESLSPGGIGLLTLLTLCVLGFGAGAAVEWHRDESAVVRRVSE